MTHKKLYSCNSELYDIKKLLSMIKIVLYKEIKSNLKATLSIRQQKQTKNFDEVYIKFIICLGRKNF